MKHFKTTLLACMLLAAANRTTAQHVYTNANERDKKPVQTTPLFNDSTTNIREKLVLLAMQGPLMKETDHDNRIADLTLKKAKNSWLNLLTVSTNYNDQSFAKKNPNQNYYVYPKYFFGITIPVGIFFSRGAEIKIAREQAAVSRNKQDDAKLQLRSEVLTQYEQYHSMGELIRVQSQVIEDEQAVFLQTEQKFRDGTVSLADFNMASKALNNEIAQRIKLQMQQNVYKVELERYIGMPLEEALKR
ncbi:TolC family protein [Deminuibacter soli]|uniref:TolC family protein n=1 Tax=Deminuibacter soli TaxID=2291815 RepID=A0A3E1NQF7_9BACT|nr:TolC family protein [Deminuibacter soli]RFM30189.1 hypothetical protein DXN05_04245 [Deminuibacter soli]